MAEFGEIEKRFKESALKEQPLHYVLQVHAEGPNKDKILERFVLNLGMTEMFLVGGEETKRYEGIAMRFVRIGPTVFVTYDRTGERPCAFYVRRVVENANSQFDDGTKLTYLLSRPLDSNLYFVEI